MNYKPTRLPDYLITLPVILLLSFGVLVIYSSDSRLALFQITFGILGLLVYWLFSTIELENWRSYFVILYGAALVLLIAVFILDFETRGSVRWIPIGPIKLQPSEFAKPILVLCLSGFWIRRLPSWRNILLSLFMVLPLAGLTFLQPDLGTSLTMIALWLFILIGANISIFKFAIMGIISGLLMPITWEFFLKDYQKSRIISFLSPESDPLGIGYNVIQSMIAVGSGQFFGLGLGHGTQSRLQFLPEYRTDFIFASIAEEFGFLGSIIVLILYGLLIGRILFLLSKVKNKFAQMVIFGVLGMLFFQIVVNIGMNIGILPVTGITLPLLSYGGSSIFAVLLSLGFVVSVTKLSRREEIEE